MDSLIHVGLAYVLPEDFRAHTCCHDSTCFGILHFMRFLSYTHGSDCCQACVFRLCENVSARHSSFTNANHMILAICVFSTSHTCCPKTRFMYFRGLHDSNFFLFCVILMFCDGREKHMLSHLSQSMKSQVCMTAYFIIYLSSHCFVLESKYTRCHFYLFPAHVQFI